MADAAPSNRTVKGVLNLSFQTKYLTGLALPMEDTLYVSATAAGTPGKLESKKGPESLHTVTGFELYLLPRYRPTKPGFILGAAR